MIVAHDLISFKTVDLKINQSAILESMIRKTRLSMDTRCLIVRMLKAQKTVNKVNRSLSSLLVVRLTFTTLT